MLSKILVEENMEKDEEVRKVAPIRVVNLASLQNIKIVNRELPATRQSRRKSMHQVRSNSEEQIEFIESHTELSNDDNSNSTIASSSNSTTQFRRSFPMTPRKASPKKMSRETRTNENLMKRVALLRVFAEYMLKELQINNVVFGENQSLEMLKAQYLREKETLAAERKNKIKSTSTHIEKFQM